MCVCACVLCFSCGSHIISNLKRCLTYLNKKKNNNETSRTGSSIIIINNNSQAKECLYTQMKEINENCSSIKRRRRIKSSKWNETWTRWKYMVYRVKWKDLSVPIRAHTNTYEFIHIFLSSYILCDWETPPLLLLLLWLLCRYFLFLFQIFFFAVIVAVVVCTYVHILKYISHYVHV